MLESERIYRQGLPWAIVSVVSMVAAGLLLLVQFYALSVIPSIAMYYCAYRLHRV